MFYVHDFSISQAHKMFTFSSEAVIYFQCLVHFNDFSQRNNRNQ